VMSELLSNSLRHAHPLASGQLRVAWMCSDSHIEVAVSDGGAATEPRAGRPTLSSLGGRGLGIVEYLADRWGVRHESESTTVWALVHTSWPAQNGQARTTGTPALREVG
jgi:anti-sigma regulatory factor (Ser/Thr protein kinase)